MNTKFYSRPEWMIKAKPYKIFWFIRSASVVLVFVIYFAASKLLAIVLMFCLVLKFIVHFYDVSIEDAGFYIKGEKVYLQWPFLRKELFPQKIAGIKIMRMYYRVGGGAASASYGSMYYADGRPIYLMILLSEVLTDMYNYKENHYYFKRSFKKNIIYVAEFDPEAVKYLKTLNPDIKVFY